MKTLTDIHNKQDIITIIDFKTDDKTEILKSSIVAIKKGKFNDELYITYVLNGNTQLSFNIDDVVID